MLSHRLEVGLYGQRTIGYEQVLHIYIIITLAIAGRKFTYFKRHKTNISHFLSVSFATLLFHETWYEYSVRGGIVSDETRSLT